MISFKYKNQIKRIAIPPRLTEEELATLIANQLNVKGMILGFKTQNGKYFDVDYFCWERAKFINKVVEVVQVSDQLEISFTSDNLSTSFIPPARSHQNKAAVEQGPRTSNNTNNDCINIGYIDDLSNADKVIARQSKPIVFLFVLDNKSMTGTLFAKINSTALKHSQLSVFYHISRGSSPASSITIPYYSIYLNKKCIYAMALADNFDLEVQYLLVKAASSTSVREDTLEKTIQKLDSQDDCPSFITNNVIERITKDTAYEYIQQMFNQMIITEREYHGFLSLIDNEFSKFCKIFCKNLTDTDIQSFRSQILAQLQVYRVEENSLFGDSEEENEKLQPSQWERPISRQERRGRSANSPAPQEVEVIKMENYLEILDTLSDIMLQDDLGVVKRLVIEQNSDIFGYFEGFLSRSYDRIKLANYLVIYLATIRDDTRPISRCFPRGKNSVNGYNPRGRHKVTSYPPALLEDTDERQDIALKSMTNNISKINRQPQEEVPEFGQNRIGSGRKSRDIDEELDAFKRTKVNNFVNTGRETPINSLSRVVNKPQTYKSVEKSLMKRSDQFTAGQFGLLLEVLRNHNEGIWNSVVILEANPNSPRALAQLKEYLDEKLSFIMRGEFMEEELDFIYKESQLKKSPIFCIFQTFKYEGNVEIFIEELRKEIERRPQPKSRSNSKNDNLIVVNAVEPDNSQEEGIKCTVSYDQFIHSTDKIIDSKEKLRIKQLQSFYESVYWENEYQEMISSVQFSEHTRRVLQKMLDRNSPSLYPIIREYIQSNSRRVPVDKSLIEKLIKNDERNYKSARIAKYEAFRQIIRIFQAEGKLTQNHCSWLCLNFVDQNPSVVGAFEAYLVSKDEIEYLDNLDSIIKLQHLKMEPDELDTFVNRLTFFLMQIYEHPNILKYTLTKYGQAFKGICELYHSNNDSNEFYESVDILNSYCFQNRFLQSLSKSNVSEEGKNKILLDFKAQSETLVRGVIAKMQWDLELDGFFSRYLRPSPKKLDSIEENRSEERFDVDSRTSASKKPIFSQIKTIAQRYNNLTVEQSISLVDENSAALQAIWQVYKVNGDHQDLLESLELLIEHHKKNEQGSRTNSARKGSNNYEETAGAYKQNLNSSADTLIKLNGVSYETADPLLNFALGLTPRDPELQKLISQQNSSDGAQKLADYRSSRLISMLMEVLKAGGVREEDGQKALGSSGEEVEKLVLGYLSDRDSSGLVSKIQELISSNE